MDNLHKCRRLLAVNTRPTGGNVSGIDTPKNLTKYASVSCKKEKRAAKIREKGGEWV